MAKEKNKNKKEEEVTYDEYEEVDSEEAVKEEEQMLESSATTEGQTVEGKQKEELIIRRNLFVDMWAFLGMHATNINIIQKLKTAEDRQFTVGMDINGKVSEDPVGSKIGKESRKEIAIMAIRSKLWEPPKEELEKTIEKEKRKIEEQLKKGIKKRGGRLTKEQKGQLDEQLASSNVVNLYPENIDRRRLVIKMFATTGKKIHWKGTIEELTSREVHNSLASKHPLVNFVVLIPGYDYVTLIEQNLKYFALAPVYSFSYYDEKNEKMWYFTIKQRFISIGIDYDVYTEGRKVAFIDGKLIGLGGNSNVKIYDEVLAKDRKFGDILILFTSTVGYQRIIRRNIRKRMKSIIKNGSNIHIIEDEEFWMLKNPRRMIR